MPLAKATLERLIEASPDIVVATDSRGRVAFYNDGARDLLGYAREEIIGRPVVDLYPSLDEARRVMAAMRAGGGGGGGGGGGADRGRGRVVTFPTTFVTKEEVELPVSISGVILKDASGEEQGTIGFAKDLREMLRKDQLAVLGEVAIGLSHEINNPLTAIVAHLSLLERFVFKHEGSPGAAHELERIGSMREEIRRIEVHLSRLREMAEFGEYESTAYQGTTRMLDLSPATGGPLAGRRVLVVDDDRAVRESVTEILRAEGCVVCEASNGRRAIEALEAQRFDLVLSDVVMPEMDGHELLLEARRLWPETMVVLMTAFYHDRDHILKRSRLVGLEGVLFKKPLKPDQLVAKLADLLKTDRPDPS